MAKSITTDDKRPASETLSAARSSSSSSEDDRIARLIKDEPKANWKSYLWDTLNKSPEERRFLFKLDAVILTLASLGYFIKVGVQRLYRLSFRSANVA
jgi:ACS family pantothenate transporter-like MFS transporter